MSMESLELDLASNADQVKSKLCTSDSFIKSKQLERELGLSGARIRQCVRHLRQHGEPIVSNVKGYKFSKDPAEIKATVAHLHSRSFNMLQTARAMNQYLENQYQTSLLI